MRENFDLHLFLNESINRRKSETLFEQIYQKMREAILTRRMRVGAKLPATRLLAKDLKVSRNTVMAVYDQLIAEGYLNGKLGSGTFVAEEILDNLLETRTQHIQNTQNITSLRNISKRGQVFDNLNFAFSSAPNKPRAFQTGFSAIDEFPVEIWTRLASRRLRKIPRNRLDYCDTQGYPLLREEIAKYLGASRGVRCESSQIIIVAGSQQGLDLTARVMLDAGDEAWIEDPNYIGAYGAMLGAGIKLTPVPLDSEGLSIKAGQKLAPAARAAYVTPSHQFPLGTVMSLARRLELLEWANQNSAWIIEDDYDSEFRYDGKPLMALQGLDNQNRVIYIGTFSKVLFPSLRLGYLVVPPDLVKIFTKVLAFMSFHTPILEQIVLTDFINEGHFGRHIRRMRSLYAERQKIVLQAISENLSEYLEVEKDVAGMHIVTWLKNGLCDQDVAQRALEYSVYVPPVSFYCLNAKIRDGLLLGYTGVSPTEIKTGIKRLQKVFQSLLN